MITYPKFYLNYVFDPSVSSDLMNCFAFNVMSFLSCYLNYFSRINLWPYVKTKKSIGTLPRANRNDAMEQHGKGCGVWTWTRKRHLSND